MAKSNNTNTAPVVENNTVNNTINELPTATPESNAAIKTTVTALNTNVTSTLLSPELVKHERGIRTAQKAFYTIGENLNYIVKHGLYQERGFSTFETYVDLMFDMSRGYSYKMIDAFRVKTVLLDDTSQHVILVFGGVIVSIVINSFHPTIGVIGDGFVFAFFGIGIRAIRFVTLNRGADFVVA